MIKKSLLIWVVILTFGIASMPVLGFSSESKQTGNTESTSKKPKKKHSKSSSKKNKKSNKKGSKKSGKKKRGSKKYKSGGKKKYSKSKKHSKYSKNVKGKKHSKGKKNTRYVKGKKHSKKRGSKRNRNTYVKKHYTPPSNSNNVEYRNYKRSDENTGTKENIEKIAPQKEIRKEPKKEGDQ